jgi:hypothetical protein
MLIPKYIPIWLNGKDHTVRDAKYFAETCPAAAKRAGNGYWP